MRDYASLYSKLLADLGLAGASDFGIYSDTGPKLAARLSLATSFYKKLAPLGNRKSADEAALKKFKAINSQLSSFPEKFVAENEAESVFYDVFRDEIRKCLDLDSDGSGFDLEYIREHMMIGPGASQKADSRHFVSKLFESPISYVNQDLIRYYRAALSETGLWADAEMRRFQSFGFVKVRGGKLFFAPKNAEISRTCCTEALLEMLIQQAIGAFIEERLIRNFGINLSIQPDRNRELARIGSIDGSIATIDLVSASDSISKVLVRRDLPDGFLKAMLFASRSEFAVLPNGEEVRLSMISTMGNAFTFPLQTLIFAATVRAVYTCMGFPCTDSRTEFGVFGDDICVRKEAYEFTVRMLTKLGFSVNVSKSFNSGPFRESCGHDYYSGVNIRGIYIKSLETPQQVCSAINRLNRWSALHGVNLTSTIQTLMTWISKPLLVPPSESDDAGIHVPFKATTPRLTNSYWFKYRCYKKRVKKVKVIEPDADEPPINPEGVCVGFLSGHIRRRDVSLTQPGVSYWAINPATGISVSLRDRPGARPRYQIVNREIPFWDYLPDPKMAETFLEGYEWRAPLTGGSYKVWEDLVVASLIID